MHKGYKCLHIFTLRIYISRDVIFDEERYLSGFLKSTKIKRDSFTSVQKFLPACSASSSQDIQDIDASTAIKSSCATSLPIQSSSSSVPALETSSSTRDEGFHNQQHPMITRAKSGILKPNLKYALVSRKLVIAKPKIVKEALQHEGWVQPMKFEIEAIERNNTRTLVLKEDSMNVIGVKSGYSQSSIKLIIVLSS